MKTPLLACFLFLLSYQHMTACQCDVPEKVIEFMAAPDVFLGRAVSKTYSEDKQYYTVKFEVIRHFKEGENNKKYYEFTLVAEGEYTGNFNTCDWNVDLGEVWVIYTWYCRDELRFGYNCSNSRPVRQLNTPLDEDRLVANTKILSLSDFIVDSSDGRFESSKPEINIDSLLRPYYQKDFGDAYGDNFVNVITDIDTIGRVISISYHGPRQRAFSVDLDHELGLNRYHPLKETEPATEFARDVMQELSKIKTWDPVYIAGSRIPVRYRNYMQFHKKKDSIIAHYKIH